MLAYLNALSSLKTEMEAAIEHGRLNRARDLILDFHEDLPLAAGLIKAAFTGSPEEIVDKASAYFPALKDVPGAVEFAAELQRLLREAWNKKRGGAKVAEGKRLKA